MKPEEQRIKIAEACGWEPCDGMREHLFEEPFMHCWWSPEKEITRNCDVPDYLNDLNAMAEAEATLVQTPHYYAYYERLYQMTGSCMAYGLNATPAQRAEAFLRTLNLWTP